MQKETPGDEPIPGLIRGRLTRGLDTERAGSAACGAPTGVGLGGLGGLLTPGQEPLLGSAPDKDLGEKLHHCKLHTGYEQAPFWAAVLEGRGGSTPHP